MFDIGWQEFILIALVTLVVVGPKDLPRVIRTVSQWVRKARSLASEFQGSLEEMAREAELDDVRRQVQSISREGVGASLEKHMDPTGEIRRSVEEAKAASGADEIEEALEDVRSDTQALARPASVSPTAAPAPVPPTPVPSAPSASVAAAPSSPSATSSAEKPAEAPKPVRKAAAKRSSTAGVASEKPAPKKAAAPAKTAKPRRAAKNSSGAEAGEA